jgi:hypothetical protein
MRSMPFRIAGIAASRSSTILESSSRNSLNARLSSSPNAVAASAATHGHPTGQVNAHP